MAAAPPVGVLYAWGVAGDASVPPCFPARDRSRTVDAAGDCPYPVEVPFAGPGVKAPLARKASADCGVFAVLDDKGRVWGWSARRGKGCIDNTPSILPLPTPATDVAAGGGFIVAVLENGDAAVVGSNDVTIPHPGAPEARFTACDACENGVLLLDDQGVLYHTQAASGKPTAVLSLKDAGDAVTAFSAGAMCFGAVTKSGRVYTWGDGVQGNLGLGKNIKEYVETPARVPGFGAEEGDRVAVSIGCCRGQSQPKRNGSSPGQEGPRVHVTTDDGRLFIAGTTHKGLGADHLNKVLYGKRDHLLFYEVGGPAADASATDAVPTGGAEDLKSHPEEAARRMGITPGNFGKDGNTHYLEDVKIVSSLPAHIHSLALAADGRLFAWGCGSNGRTGLRAFMRGPGGSKRRMKCYISSPTAIEALDGRRVLSIGIGRYWGLAVVERKARAASMAEK